MQVSPTTFRDHLSPFFQKKNEAPNGPHLPFNKPIKLAEHWTTPFLCLADLKTFKNLFFFIQSNPLGFIVWQSSTT